MKRLKIHQLIYNKHVLKCCAFIFGSLYWYIISQNDYIEKWVAAPLYIYEISENYTYDIPEHINVCLKARRKDFALQDNNLSVHLDGRTLKPGKNSVPITYDNLFLPTQITLVCYKPSPLFVMVNTTV